MREYSATTGRLMGAISQERSFSVQKLSESHASSECGLGYRCVESVEKHEPGQCPRNGANKNTTKASCINCHEASIVSDHHSVNTSIIISITDGAPTSASHRRSKMNGALKKGCQNPTIILSVLRAIHLL